MGAGSVRVRILYSALYVTAVRTDMRSCMNHMTQHVFMLQYSTMHCSAVQCSAEVVKLYMSDVAAEVYVSTDH